MAEKIQSKEFEINDSLTQATLHALKLVCLRHRKLGDKGRSKDAINQFGEQALVADLMAEETVIEYFSKYAKLNGITLEVRGEETATTFLGDHGEKYFAVLDGLDGSSNYLDPNEWPYGTMFAIAKGSNPSYQDFKVAGIALPEENRVLIASKGSGVFVYDIEKLTSTKINSFKPEKFDETKILSDNYFPEAKKMLGKMQDVWPRTGSTAASVVAIAVGEQLEDSLYPPMNLNWQGLADITRKGNLEQPVLYLILSELGGITVDQEGNKIDIQIFKKWGQTEKIPVISARSSEITQKILSKLTL